MITKVDPALRMLTGQSQVRPGCRCVRPRADGFPESPCAHYGCTGRTRRPAAESFPLSDPRLDEDLRLTRGTAVSPPAGSPEPDPDRAVICLRTQLGFVALRWGHGPGAPLTLPLGDTAGQADPVSSLQPHILTWKLVLGGCWGTSTAGSTGAVPNSAAPCQRGPWPRQSLVQGSPNSLPGPPLVGDRGVSFGV